MHNHYIINNTIEFYPAASTLRNLNAPEKVIVLNSPAGRCLLLLITRRESIVTQQEFMEIVWEKNGMLVSPNTFYQNISILRKGLKNAGLMDDPVVTIPRVGLTLASGTEIKTRSIDNESALSQENAPCMDEITLTEEPDEPMTKTYRPDAEALPQREKQVPDKPLKKLLAKIACRKVLPSLILPAMGLMMLALLMLIIKINNMNNSSRSHFNGYFLMADVGGCHVFIADNEASSAERTETLSLVEKFKSSCSHYPWVYVTHYDFLPRTSVVRCNKPMNIKNQCISEYHFTGLNSDD